MWGSKTMWQIELFKPAEATKPLVKLDASSLEDVLRCAAVFVDANVCSDYRFVFRVPSDASEIEKKSLELFGEVRPVLN
jgi:hypothetical protein